MDDGSVTIINIFELFKQTALIDTDKNCGDWERRILYSITSLGQMLVGTKFCSWSVKLKFPSYYVGFLLWINKKQASKKKINLFSLDYDFCLIHFRPSPFYVFLKTFLYVFMGYRKGTSDCNRLIFQLTKALSTNKFWAHVNIGVGGSDLTFFWMS